MAKTFTMLNLDFIVIFLLGIHIACGFTSLFSAFGALLSSKGQSRHRQFGRLFFYAMTCVFVTAIPLSIIKNNLFLFLVAIFSYYLAFSVTNIPLKPQIVLWVGPTILLAPAIFWWKHKVLKTQIRLRHD